MSNQKNTVYVDFITCDGTNSLKIEGYLDGPDSSIDELVFDVSGDVISPHKVSRPTVNNSEQADLISKDAFDLKLKINKTQKLKLTVKHGDQKLKLKTNMFSGLSSLLVSYKKLNDSLLVSYGNSIRIFPRNKVLIFTLELLTQLSIITNLRITDSYRKFALAQGAQNKIKRIAIGIIAALESLITIPQSLLLRWAYFLIKPRIKRSIWIVSDRVAAAGDNGEAFFRHIVSQAHLDIEVYFSISPRSKDYERLHALGKTLNYGSFKHKLYFLLSDKIISSHADTEVTNPFFRQVDRYLDLFNFDFIFLQHGVIRHDLSAWLNRFEKNIALFVTSSSKEQQLVLSHAYYYRKDQVVVTGLPRHDRLINNSKKKIIIAPTYRNFLVNSRTNKQGERRYDQTFKQSQYFNFYNDFINNPELIELLKQQNITGEFYLHPVFKFQAIDFEENDVFKVMDYPYDYATAISEGAMLVSDHSSIVFDFAYLGKPVLYAHFDADDFYSGHSFTKPESFDEQENGFGDVCYDLESLIIHTKDLAETGFKISPKYKKRAENYFDFHDKHNSDRVYRAILNLDKGTDHE